MRKKKTTAVNLQGHHKKIKVIAQTGIQKYYLLAKGQLNLE